MIRMNQADVEAGPTDWQPGFLELLPEIHRCLRLAFRRCDAEARDEAIADGTLLCLLAYLKLDVQGRANKVTASSLAWFAVRQVRSGRITSCRLNADEPLAPYAQRRRGIRVEQLDGEDPRERNWIDAIAHDRRSSVVDQVAARLGIAAWLATLCRRTRQIAADLAQGSTTSEVASKYRVSRGRISQMRRELAQSWAVFQHEPVPAMAR